MKILCRSGKGGADSAHLHRAKYIPKGGPDGGDGGRGGHIYLKGNRNLWTLIHLKYQRHVFATDGQAGYENQSTGRAHEYEVLCNELQTFNPDLVDKPRVLAITKCDLADNELIDMLRPSLPQGIDTVFISSVAQRGLTELKDVLWRTINDDVNICD